MSEDPREDPREDPNEDAPGTSSAAEEKSGAQSRPEEKKDPISELFEERDRPKIKESREKAFEAGKSQAGASEASPKRKTLRLKEEDKEDEESSKDAIPQNDSSKDDSSKDDSSKDAPPLEEDAPCEAEILKKKLEKTEKILAENQRYGRSNAQKVKTAFKIAQKLTEEGLLTAEEAKELLDALQGGTEEPAADGTSSPGDYPYQANLSQASLSQMSPFAQIFQTANRELENILKYTDDDLLPDKVAAFDYFLSAASPAEIETVLEDLTALMDDPVQLAKKMLSMGAKELEASYKGVKAAGGYKNYLSVKEQEIEKLQKKLDKLEKKLLQYEDFDKPRYRLEEMGEAGGQPVKDALSRLFEERDRARDRR